MHIQPVTNVTRRWVAKLGAISGLVVLTLIAGAYVRADAPDPFTIDVDEDGLSVSLSGTWSWARGGCNDRWAGFAVHWDDPAAQGHLVPAHSGPDFYVGTPSDNDVHTNNPPDCGAPVSGSMRNGSWGPLTHTYTAPGEYNVCVLMYDIHHNGGEVTDATGKHSLVAGGDDRNSDNSAETNDYTQNPEAVCAAVTFILEAPTPTPNVTPAGGDPTTPPPPTPTPATATPSAPSSASPTPTQPPSPTPTNGPSGTPTPPTPTPTSTNPTPPPIAPTPTPRRTPTPPPDPSDGPATPTPEPTSDPNVPIERGMTCLQGHPELTMLELDQDGVEELAGNGTGHASDGTLTVDIWNYDGSTFDWGSNLPIDALFAETSGGGRLVRYDPESAGALGVDTSESIRALTFCYDLEGGSVPDPTSGTEPLPHASTPPTDVVDDVAGSIAAGRPATIALLVVAMAGAFALGASTRFGRRQPQGTPIRPWSTGG